MEAKEKYETLYARDPVGNRLTIYRIISLMINSPDEIAKGNPRWIENSARYELDGKPVVRSGNRIIDPTGLALHLEVNSTVESPAS